MSPEEQIIKLTQLETQIDRFTSDLESEKATRSRVNSDIMSQLKEIISDQQKSDRIIYMGLGGLAVLQFVVAFVFHK